MIFLLCVFHPIPWLSSPSTDFQNFINMSSGGQPLCLPIFLMSMSCVRMASSGLCQLLTAGHLTDSSAAIWLESLVLSALDAMSVANSASSRRAKGSLLLQSCLELCSNTTTARGTMGTGTAFSSLRPAGNVRKELSRFPNEQQAVASSNGAVGSRGRG